MNKIRSEVIDKLAETLKPAAVDRADRTTFKLTKEALDDLEWISDQEGCSVRAVLDAAIEFFISDNSDAKNDSPKNIMLVDIIRNAQSVSQIEGIRKSFAIGHVELNSISFIAAKCGIERDNLLSNIIKTYREILEKNYEKKKQYTKAALVKLKKMLECWNGFSKQEVEAIYSGGVEDQGALAVENLDYLLNGLVTDLEGQVTKEKAVK